SLIPQISPKDVHIITDKDDENHPEKIMMEIMTTFKVEFTSVSTYKVPDDLEKTCFHLGLDSFLNREVIINKEITVNNKKYKILYPLPPNTELYYITIHSIPNMSMEEAQ